MLYCVLLLLSALFVCGHYNEPMAFIIGEGTPAGAVTLTKEDDIDLATDCGNPRCPSVVIFNGEQEGTQELVNCYPGQLYTFINKSKRDNGIIVQHKGGRFGSKSIPQFGLGQCFCYIRTHDDDRIEQEGLLGTPKGSEIPDNDDALNATAGVNQETGLVGAELVELSGRGRFGARFQREWGYPFVWLT